MPRSFLRTRPSLPRRTLLATAWMLIVCAGFHTAAASNGALSHERFEPRSEQLEPSLQAAALPVELPEEVASTIEEDCEPFSDSFSGSFAGPSLDVWLVSTRHLGPCPRRSLNALRVCRAIAGQGWQPSSIEELLSDESSASTVVYVHGNRMAASDARQRANLVASALQDPTAEARRLIIWSWPSDPMKGPLRDIRSKAARTDTESYYLAQLLASLNPEQPASLMGYSYGARVVLGSLHLLGGGCLRYGSCPVASPRGAHRVVLMAAAVHRDWLLPCHRFHAAPSQMERLLLFYNPCDRALKRYHLLEKCGHPEALGYRGLPRGLANVQATQYNVSRTVGKTHNERCYYQANWIRDLIQAELRIDAPSQLPLVRVAPTFELVVQRPTSTAK